jgi:dynamin family protein
VAETRWILPIPLRMSVSTMADLLTDSIIDLVDEARPRAIDATVTAQLDEVRDRVSGPLRLAIAGRVKAGKSTLMNAMLGEELAPTDAGECTRIVTWYRQSHRPYAKVFPHAGPATERPYRREDGALQVDLGDLAPDQIDHLEIGWPTSKLQALTLIDTPGIASISTDVSARTHRALAADDGRVPVADAVLYLLRHTHASDLRFLESFHDDELALGTPINAVGILSRADEIGSCRRDAMDVAQRVATRYAKDPRLRRLCPLVIPVNGLLGFAATSLRESEYASLLPLSRSPDDVLASLLLTADRFLSDGAHVDVPAGERARLIDRLGFYGVRMCVELLRTGAVSTSTQLSVALTKLSGLDRLLLVLTRQFQERTRLLKARSAVSALQDLFARHACNDANYLLGRLEEITAGAHEFEEVRLLFDLRAGEIELSEQRSADLDRLLGGSGHDPASRLALAADASPQEIRKAVLATLGTWRSVAEHPLTKRSGQIAARTATRTLEGLLASVQPPSPPETG